ncbi:DtxR family Mn-dependent transcriptional regulator [Agromyces flavus]|uniref:Manganese transport regulator n=1 Tax=Agromyces flavus TaxID=589382 RepID=A0A1H1ZIS9_9MICO|nr:metal-dependent transcriptional regulator [Agromyces flavus]MCP2367114.1 DtxR family Mn-dependent transcriptional regulator [Agromyces flavus]GGI46372.1 transcriptional regulator [Agromyces flavus]SDT33594.1 iron (metal) dependent repressor, DtxR family [Agromyces flavus]
MPATQSPAVEDYLKTVYAHTEWQPDAITPSGLAAALGVAPSSVTEMVKKMAGQGLVQHVPYGAIRLTDAGRTRALAVVRRHRLIETWLVREMGYAWDEVHDEAEILEHALSDRLLEAIDERLGRPARDPHGDAIPRADGTLVSEPAVRLDEAPAGHVGRVIRISDRDPAVLRELDGAGVGPGSELRVADGADAASVAVMIGDDRRAIPRDAAAGIWVSA